MFDKGAIISDCKNYRYVLWRVWNPDKPKCMFIMLNPSKADGNIDDPTIRRCIGFADAWGYGGFYVCNLFPYRATRPQDLLMTDDPFGQGNKDYIKELYDKVEIVVGAWGNANIVDKLMRGLSEFRLIDFTFPKLHYLELSNTHRPKHPLYLKKDCKPKKFRGRKF